MASGVRLITADEMGRWVEQMGVGFHFRPPPGRAEFLREQVDLGRTWGAFDGGTVVGTLRSFATELTVPGGGQIDAAALTNVTVAPTHRRRGLLTEMIRLDLEKSAQRGESVGILVASEWPIYGRYGYGPAVDAARYEIDTTTIRFREKAVGGVELVEDSELRKLAPEVYEKHRLSQPGAIERRPDWWDRHLHQVEVPGDRPEEGVRSAVYRRSSTDEVEGYVRYQPKSEWQDMRPIGKLGLDELFATSTDAYHALWSYCCGVDLLTAIDAGSRPVDELLQFLVTDGRSVRQTARWDFVWVRILDVEKALASRRYLAEGRIVIEVGDPMGFAAGRYVLEGGPDGASCARTDSSPDLTFDVDALGSVYMGGYSVSALVEAGRVTVHNSHAVGPADALFLSARAPWCATWF